MNKKDKMVEQIKDAANEALAPYSMFIETEDDDFIFHSILGYQVGGPVVAISMQDSTTHVFPLSRVKYMKHYITPVEFRKE